MPEHSLHDIYSKILPSYKKLFVVPLIRFDFSSSDYLYLLYKPLIENHPTISITNTSAIWHWKFVWDQLTSGESILHYHWLEFQDVRSLLGIPYKIFCIWMFKVLGGKIVWTVHNKTPHNKKWLVLHRKLHSWMADISDVILVHSKHVMGEIVDYYKTSLKKLEIHPHPKFPTIIFPKENAIDKLNFHFGLDLKSNDVIVVFFGAISEYKKIPETIELLKEQEFNGTVVVFGYVKKGQQKIHSRLKVLEKQYNWVHYRPGFVDDDLIPYIMNSSDWCIFNYSDVTTSGAFEMAHAYQRKIIAPKKVSFLDYLENENTFMYSTEAELHELIKGMS